MYFYGHYYIPVMGGRFGPETENKHERNTTEGVTGT